MKKYPNKSKPVQKTVFRTCKIYLLDYRKLLIKTLIFYTFGNFQFTTRVLRNAEVWRIKLPIKAIFDTNLKSDLFSFFYSSSTFMVFLNLT